MGGIIVLIAAVFVGIPLLFFILLKNHITEKFNELSRKIDGLDYSPESEPAQKKPSPSEKSPEAETPKESEKEEPEFPKEEDSSTLPTPIEQEMETEPEPVFEEPVFSAEAIKEETAFGEAENIPPKPKKPSFFERNPDLEKFIGENLINKIGIGILVLGIAFFVKYAIDQNWINEIGRVFIGLLAGGLLIGLAHRMRKTFKAFSSVLVGGGLAVFYFTITIAFQEYQLMSQTLAFGVMVLITAFAVALSMVYNRQDLAVLAIVGGFGTPFMVSTGEGNYMVLFTYIAILNTGMLTLAYFRKWNVVNIVAYAFTVLLYGGWLINENTSGPDFPYMGGLVFASAFYLVFFLMNIINNLKTGNKFSPLEIGILLSNTFLYYSAGMIILQEVQDGAYQGLFTAVLAVFNFVFAYFLYRRENADRNLVYLLVGLVLTFLSLTAPVQLEGNYITLFWAAEAVLLLWLSQKSGIRIMKLGAVVVTALMLISLVMDWNQIYLNPSTDIPLSIIFNKGFITGFVTIASFSLSYYFTGREEEKMLFFYNSKTLYRYFLAAGIVLTAYLFPYLELRHQLIQHVGFSGTREVVTGFYNMAFVLTLMLIERRKGKEPLVPWSISIGVLAILAHVLHYHEAISEVRDGYLTHEGASLAGYLFHYLNAAVVAVIALLSLKNTGILKGWNNLFGKAMLCFGAFVLVFLASTELDHIVVMSAYSPGFSIDEILRQNSKVGYPILWGICAFIFMATGMKKKMRVIRVLSLTLFAIILVKLFAFDIQGISEGGKIAAFISLGVLLLVISFMYQKLKKLILDEDEQDEPSQND